MAIIQSIQPVHSTQIRIHHQSDQAVLVTWSPMYRATVENYDNTADALDCAGYTKITVGISGDWNGNQMGWSESLSGLVFVQSHSSLTTSGTNNVALDTVAGTGQERIHTLARVPRFIKPFVSGDINAIPDFVIVPFAILYHI